MSKLLALLSIVVALVAVASAAEGITNRVMKIGIIGMGMVGEPLAARWSAAGHRVFVSSRHPEALNAPAGGYKGTVEEACSFADVVLLAIPFAGVQNLSPAVRKSLVGKIVMDANNAFPHRDGQVAVDVHAGGLGSGTWTAAQLSGARIVKAFNTWPFYRLTIKPGQPGQPGVPIASDDSAALETVAQLVQDAGLEPVIMGSLQHSAKLDAMVQTHGGATAERIRQDFEL